MSASDRPERGPLSRFGAPAGAGAGRPPHVLVAAVAGFVEAALLLLAALAYFTFDGAGPGFAAIGGVFLVLCAVCVLGGVQALRGRSRSVLAVAAGIAAALALLLVSIAAASGYGLDPFSASIVFLGVTVVVLLLQPPSRDYFTSNRDAR